MNKKLFFILFLVLLGASAKSQVTIGSQHTANSGSLLDLKTDDSFEVNSSKGLMLPRVSLTDINNLYPMFGDANNINENYNTSEKKEKQDILHTGLTIFNTNTIKPYICPGLYVWTGSNWQRVSEPCFKVPNFEIKLDGQSCGYTGRVLKYSSLLQGDNTDVAIDRWTLTKEGGTEQVIAGENSPILNYEFPLISTTEGKYTFTVYYKHISGEEKAKSITTDIHHSTITDYIAQSVIGRTRTFDLSTTAHKRTEGHDFGELTNLKFVKWAYIKEGTTSEVLIEDGTGNTKVTYTFPSAGTYYYKMYWEFPCEEGLDPTPDNFTETPRSTLHPLVVGKLIVK